MPTVRRALLDHPVIVGLLLLAFFGQAYRCSLIKSPVFDEPAHIAAGLSYFETGEFKVNLQHPPLLKEIGALPLWLLGVKWPMARASWVALPEKLDAGFQWRLGRDIIFENDPAKVMFWSRLPFLLLATLLGYCLYAWGRGLFGGTAAVGALILYALDPTLLAHGQLVTTDVGFAAFTLLLFYALWRYLNHRTFLRLVLCGLALGAALASKFSAVFLLPVVALLLLWAPRFIPAAVPRRGSTLVDPYASEDGGQRIVWCLYALAAMVAVAALLIHALYFLPGDPGLYFRGMLLVNADHDPTYLAFMAGHFRSRFLTYYLVAWLLKEPLPTLALVGLGVFGILRRGAVTTMDRAFVLIPPAVIFVSHSLWSHNLGIRYIIPALPFLYLAGGFGLASLIREAGFARRALAAVLVAWLAVASAGVAPDHLSYFNELACLLQEPSKIGLDGGTACGPLWLDDSNVDWGQGVWQLKSWLDAHEKGRPFRFAYFGSMRPDNYGLIYEWISVDDLMHPPSPGLYVLSAHHLARAEGQLRLRYLDGPENWLLYRAPTAVVGHAYYIYDIPPPAG
jgi:Dolichyl-phosphate-mannose-protein mannosyltransferase